jgi:hypothetical protein
MLTEFWQMDIGTLHPEMGGIHRSFQPKIFSEKWGSAWICRALGRLFVFVLFSFFFYI